ncbi:hypothetical protein BU16DRAFT_446850, partial [Lophium mytilinum]
RRASSLASSTAINAPLDVPPSFKQLHHALDALGKTAANYVNLSRLQLALRGLAGENAVVRVAVLGIGGQAHARKMARLLLADPLGGEGAWEQRVESGEVEGKGLLLRYGDEAEFHPRNPLLETVSVPAKMLERYRMEVLVVGIDVGGGGGADGPGEAILVPSLQMAAAAGPGTVVQYPVHKAVVVGEGLESGIAYGRFTADAASRSIPPEMVKVAIGIPAPSTSVGNQPTKGVTAVDLDVAAKALAKFRESIANSVAYEHGWYSSGLPAITEWLMNGLSQQGSKLKPAVKHLILSSLDDIETKITAEDADRLNQLVASTIPEHTRTSILASLRIWAEHAHTELRDHLEGAFAGKNWRKIAWWKLFWRVDDVSMIASEVLERRWLVDAEKGSIYLTGRLEEAGLFKGQTRPGEEVLTKSPVKPLDAAGFTTPVSPFKWRAVAQHKATLVEDGEVRVPAPKPWPMQIPVMRALLLKDTVPPLQALAQSLVITTLSTTSLASALSALVYLSVPSLSVVESAAVAVFGVVWALRRMQVRWEEAREAWQGEITEEGRKALKYTEDLVAEVVKTGGQPDEDVEGVEQRRAAREAVL